MRHLNCRGLGRIWLSEKVDPVITFLTLKGYINHGLVAVPKSISESLQPENTKVSNLSGVGIPQMCKPVQSNFNGLIPLEP